MFRSLQPPAPPPPPSRRRLLTRLAFLVGALVVLMLGSWWMRRESPAPPPALYSDASGTVAARPRARAEGGPSAVGSVAALLLLGGGGAYALHVRRKAGAPGGGAAIEALGQLNLSPTQQLRLVACGGDVLLLGVAAGQITLLKSFPREAFAPETALPAAVKHDPAAAKAPAAAPEALRLSAPFAAFLRDCAHRAPSAKLN